MWSRYPILTSIYTLPPTHYRLSSRVRLQVPGLWYFGNKFLWIHLDLHRRVITWPASSGQASVPSSFSVAGTCRGPDSAQTSPSRSWRRLEREGDCHICVAERSKREGERGREEKREGGREGGVRGRGREK